MNCVEVLKVVPYYVHVMLLVTVLTKEYKGDLFCKPSVKDY